MRPIPPFALSSRSSAAAQQEEHEEEDEEQTSAEEGEGQTPQLIQEEYEEEQAAEEQEEVEQQTPPLITPAKAKAGRGRPRKVKKEPLPADSHEDDGDEQQQQEEEQTPQEVGEQQTPLITPAKAKAGRGQPKKVGNDGDEQPPEIEEIETPTLEKLSKERLQAREEKEARLAEKKRRNEEKEGYLWIFDLLCAFLLPSFQPLTSRPQNFCEGPQKNSRSQKIENFCEKEKNNFMKKN